MKPTEPPQIDKARPSPCEVAGAAEAMGLAWIDNQDVREWALMVPDLMRWAHEIFYREKVREFAWLLDYAMELPSRKKRKELMDIDAEVKRWVDTLAGLLTAHTREEWDRYDFTSDDILRPLLQAPVRQIREFSAKLRDALAQDPRIPFWIWRSFEQIVMLPLKSAKDAQVKELKVDIARRIAEMVEADVQPQLGEALINALQWRAPETLEQVEKALRGGAKPTLKGRESCLFLCVGEHKVML